jgi:hypothetical protein
MNYHLADYIRAAETKQKMPHTYAIVHFDCDDGLMLYGIHKTVNFCNGAFIGNKTWTFINDGGLKTETFEAKIKGLAKRFEDSGYNVTITII